MSPGAQTQRHHLAAHEAAIADNQSARSPSLQLPGDDHFSSAAEEQRYHNDSMLQRPGGNDASPLSNQADPKRRKRVFSNRTKTGCITCRRRKKKCDEGKPECINCKRGGFVCEGYSGKVSWQKPPGKTGSSHTALIRSEEDRPDSSSASPIARQVSQTLMPHPPAATSITTTPVRLERPVETPRPDDAAKKTQEDLRSPSKTLPTGTYASSVASQVTPRPSVTTTVPPATSTPAATAAASTTIPGNPPQSEKQRQLAYSHTALNAATGSFSTPQMRSEKQKMISSELYHASAPELVAERDSCKAACWRFNHIAANPSLNVSEAEKGRLLLDVLRPGQNWEVVGTGGAAGAPGPCTYVTDMGTTSDIVDVQVDAPFNCSYGYNIRLGKNVYIEFGCTILDSCSVTIKDRTILSPNVSIYSATHPIDPRKRNGSRGPEMAKPVMIEEDCWLGGNVTVLGGIVIGKGSVVGAGSVVTRDVPPFTVVAGNPARVIRGIYQNGLDM
ncbi:hypothetical protein EDC01DRAFT_622896 [Geopyxis carbonaria]|nr:hypothetical protein EDC01DRAFT_622896 [Geopyxis carbonaria]